MGGVNPSTRAALESGGLGDITTTGARSGKPHRIELTFHHLGGGFFIGGKPGCKRDWWANLKADPEFTLHLRNGDDVIAHATAITDPAERDRILSAINIRWGSIPPTWRRRIPPGWRRARW